MCHFSLYNYIQWQFYGGVLINNSRTCFISIHNVMIKKIHYETATSKSSFKKNVAIKIYIRKQNVTSKLEWVFIRYLALCICMTVLWTWSQTVHCTMGELDRVSFMWYKILEFRGTVGVKGLHCLLLCSLFSLIVKGFECLYPTDFVLKKDILKNVGNETVLGHHRRFFPTMEAYSAPNLFHYKIYTGLELHS